MYLPTDPLGLMALTTGDDITQESLWPAGAPGFFICIGCKISGIWKSLHRLMAWIF